MTIASRFFGRTMKLPPASNHDVQVERDLRVPMADGVQLLADRYLPHGDGRSPLVLVRSPYGRRGIWGILFGRVLAERMEPGEGQRSVRGAMHAIADTLTAHGFAAHAEDRGDSTAVVAENCPFGDAASQHPVICAVDRGMVTGLLAGLCGSASKQALPVILSSRARGDAACTASA